MGPLANWLGRLALKALSAFGGGPENYKITAGRYPITPLANRREILSPRLTRLGAEQSESFSCARTDIRGERVVVRMVMLGSYRLRTMWVAWSLA
jgi:hypothetical protein